jgi:hypothetical protein
MTRNRRLLLFHGANLDRRSVRAQQQRSGRSFHAGVGHRPGLGFDIKSIHVVAHRMEFRNIQCLEIVVGRFDFRSFDDRKSDRHKNVFDFLENLTNQMA